MNKNFEFYRIVGHRAVEGWLRPEVLTILSVLDSIQESSGVAGAVAEIGVHHGRLFVGLNLLRRTDEHSVAIDVFDDQQYNVDNSGKGNLQIFSRNVGRWSSLDGVEISQGDSTRLDPTALLAVAHAGIRLFSIDGGHTDSIVLSDLKLAEGTLLPGGIVIADDVFNEFWPGVVSGTLDYMNTGGNLSPFAIGFNKVFFTQSDHVDRYRLALSSYFGAKVTYSVKWSEFAGHEVLVIARVRPSVRRVLRRNALARRLYYRVRSG